MSKGNHRRLESGRVAALSIPPASFYLHCLALYSVFPARSSARPSYARPLPFSLSPFLSFASSAGREAPESGASNSRILRMGRSLCEYYSALHSRFFCRVMLHRDAPLHLRVETSIRSCFSLPALFCINSPFLFAPTFCPLFCPRPALPITGVEGGNARRRGVRERVRRARCASRDGIANGGAM